MSVGVRMYAFGEVGPSLNDVAHCRGCERALQGPPYYTGKPAYTRSGERARVNYYGGFVCSQECDARACRELEDSMPGHGWGSSRKYGISPEARRRVEHTWGQP